MMKKRSILHTQTQVKRKRRLFWLKAVLVALLILLAGYGIVALARADFLTIQKISVQGTIVAPDAEIQAEADKHITGNYLFFFPKKNILLYPRSRISASIMSKFPRLEKAHVSLLQWHTLLIDVTERKPYAIWCAGDESRAVSTTEQCYFMDVTGFVFDTAPQFSGNAYTRYWGGTFDGESASEKPVGQTFKTELTFATIDSLIASLRDFKWNVTDIIVNKYGYELQTSEGTKLLINPSQDIQKTLDNLSIVLKQNTVSAPALDYVDLRFGNKVYIKRK